ncbi:hypothetical protein C8R44DRAFT_981751 [Mycena epipterygia]|nr:hypothetical protein C8R44DRAFT_981751 [Mycena epipterygia]
MFALRIASLFLLSMTFVSGSPTHDAGLSVIDKRASNAQVLTVVNTLKSSTDSILPQISALTSSGTATDATVTPHMNALTAALNTATASLTALGPGGLLKRQTTEAVAEALAVIITEISVVLQGLVLETASIPVLGGLIATLDTTLVELLVALDVVAIGVVTLLSGILVSAAVLLDSLGLGLLVGLLGI